jgi:hypothetical protein
MPRVDTPRQRRCTRPIMDATGPSAISPSRKRLALVILATIVVGQSVDILLQREDWPFSNYPMYAKLIRKRQTSLLRLYGRVTDGKAQWVMPIVDDNLVMYVPPINELRMKNILEYALSHGGEKGVRRVLRDYMAMYEERRILGQQGTPVPGPRMLDAICMRITWTLDARGGAVGEPRMEEVTAASAFPLMQPVSPTTAPVSVSEAAP